MAEIKDFKTRKTIPQAEDNKLQPNQEIIEQVEQILEKAKSGELRSIIFIAELNVNGEERIVDGWSDLLNVNNPLALLSGLILLVDDYKDYVKELRNIGAGE